MGENQIDKDKLSDLFQKANAIGDAYLWGFYWGASGISAKIRILLLLGHMRSAA
jgi:hypothetical protein